LSRVAASYTMPLTDRWFVAPEASVDFTDDNSAFLRRFRVPLPSNRLELWERRQRREWFAGANV